MDGAGAARSRPPERRYLVEQCSLLAGEHPALQHAAVAHWEQRSVWLFRVGAVPSSLFVRTWTSLVRVERARRTGNEATPPFRFRVIKLQGFEASLVVERSFLSYSLCLSIRSFWLVLSGTQINDRLGGKKKDRKRDSNRRGTIADLVTDW